MRNKVSSLRSWPWNRDNKVSLNDWDYGAHLNVWAGEWIPELWNPVNDQADSVLMN